MPDGKEGVAQAFYLAQLQACKGSCQCNVCKLLRKAADLQMEAMLNPKVAPPSPQEEVLDFSQVGAPGIPGMEE